MKGRNERRERREGDRERVGMGFLLEGCKKILSRLLNTEQRGKTGTRAGTERRSEGKSKKRKEGERRKKERKKEAGEKDGGGVARLGGTERGCQGR